MSSRRHSPELYGISERLRILIDNITSGNQAEFGRLCGIQATTLSNFINCESRISLDMALKIVKTTGVTLDWLYLGETSGLPMKFAGIVQRKKG